MSGEAKKDFAYTETARKFVNYALIDREVVLLNHTYLNRTKVFYTLMVGLARVINPFNCL